MDESDVKTIVLLALGLVALVVFVASPPGELVISVLALIPGLVWKWVLGILAFVALVAIVRRLS